MSIGPDLTLVPIDPATGQARFSPAIAYALAASEVVDLALAERVHLRDDRLVVQQREAVGDPLLDDALARLRDHSVPPTVSQWVADRGPWRIDAYIAAWEVVGTLLLVPTVPFIPGVKRIEVKDPSRVRSATERLTVAMTAGDASPYEEQAFAALVDAAGCAWHLRGWQHRSDRKRLRTVRTAACRERGDDSQARTILRQGLSAVRTHAKQAKLAGGSSRTIDEQIGLSEAGRWANGNL